MKENLNRIRIGIGIFLNPSTWVYS